MVFAPDIIVAKYDALVVEIFGKHRNEHHSDKSYASQWTKAGCSVDHITRVLRKGLQRRHSNGESVPTTLKYFDKPMHRKGKNGAYRPSRLGVELQPWNRVTERLGQDHEVTRRICALMRAENFAEANALAETYEKEHGRLTNQPAPR